MKHAAFLLLLSFLVLGGCGLSRNNELKAQITSVQKDIDKHRRIERESTMRIAVLEEEIRNLEEEIARLESE